VFQHASLDIAVVKPVFDRTSHHYFDSVVQKNQSELKVSDIAFEVGPLRLLEVAPLFDVGAPCKSDSDRDYCG